MKWVRYLLLVLLMGLVTATKAQRRGPVVQAWQRRMNELQLTAEQKRRLAILIRRERMQRMMNQRELYEILTEKQKLLLLEWKKKREENSSDSTVKQP